MSKMKRLANPLDDDPLLKELLKQLDRIETRRGFAKWKAQFLEQFEMHLEGTNVTKAGQKYHSFAKRLDRLVLLLKDLEGLITTGECSVTRCSVKARQSLSELQKSLAGMITHTEVLVPGTLEREREAGYTKFDMGAVLVRDGFVEYDRLCICNEILLHMRDMTLADVADRQLLEEMDRYWQKVQSFYEIMGTDLGLHGAIMRCREILRAEDDDFFEFEEGDEQEQDAGEKSDDDDNKDEEFEKTEWGGSNYQAPRTKQRYEKVEIYDMNVPLRFSKEDLDDDSSNGDDLSSVSEDESWCWELELPEPKPKPKPKALLPKDVLDESEPELLPPPKPREVIEKPKAYVPPPKKKETPRPKASAVKKKEDSDSEDDGDGKGDSELRYKWSGRDYYHGGGSNDWRLASKLKKKEKDSDDDSD